MDAIKTDYWEKHYTVNKNSFLNTGPSTLHTGLKLTTTTGWTGPFAKTSSNAYNSKTTQYMIILMTFLEKKNFCIYQKIL